jgi:hypothetical protein
MTHEFRGGMPYIEREHANIAASHKTLSDNIGRPDGHNSCTIRERGRQFWTGAVSSDFRSQLPDRLERFGRGGDTGAEPHKGSVERVALDDPSTSHNQPGRIEMQRTQRMSSFLDQ